MNTINSLIRSFKILLFCSDRLWLSALHFGAGERRIRTVADEPNHLWIDGEIALF